MPTPSKDSKKSAAKKSPAKGAPASPAKSPAKKATVSKKAAAGDAFNEPLFVKMLTGQNKQAQSAANEVRTMKYPNDNADITLNAEHMHVVSEKVTGKNADTVYQTMKYPSDTDELAVTLKYPSDTDEEIAHFKHAASITTSLIQDSLEMVTRKAPSDSDEVTGSADSGADSGALQGTGGSARQGHPTQKYPSDADDITDLTQPAGRGRKSTAAKATVSYTQKYPSDADDGDLTAGAPAAARATLKYPSDADDMLATMKYPSDRDEEGN